MEMSEVKTCLIVSLKILTFQVSFVNIVLQSEVDWSAIFPLPWAVNIKTYFFYAKASGNMYNNSNIGRHQSTIW